MKMFFGILGALVVGLCIGSTSVVFCPYMGQFSNKCPIMKKCCDCVHCTCCSGCSGKSCCDK